MHSRLSHIILRAGAASLALGAALATPGVANADPSDDYIDGYVHSTDEYPIPRRILRTTCTAEQLLDAAKDYTPMEFDRYMAEYKKHKDDRAVDGDLQDEARERLHWFFSLKPGDKGPRRDVSESMAATFGDPLNILYTDYAKIFVNNKGVVAKMADNCEKYPRNDESAWDWRNGS